MSKLTITIRNNGPLFISAEDAEKVQLTDHTGTLIPLPVGKGISLCRCGASQRKPFCDASHRTIGFDGTLASSSIGPAVGPPCGASPTSAGEASST